MPAEICLVLIYTVASLATSGAIGGEGVKGRESRGGGGMACEVSPYGITVGTYIFFEVSAALCYLLGHLSE